MKPDLDALLDHPPRLAVLVPVILAVLGVVLVLLLSGCAAPRSNENKLLPEVRSALSEPAQSKPAPLPPAVANALVPPADLSLPSLNGKTATVGADGWFYLTITLQANEQGSACAQTTDWWGLTSNVAQSTVG